MTSLLLSQIADCLRHAAQRIWHSLRPCSSGSEIAGMVVDVSRSRRDLVIENAVLRHQINVLRRGQKRPRLGVTDRLKLLLGASLLPTWRRAIAIVQPDTLLRWHRAGFRLFWRLRSRPRRGSPLAQETIDLIRDMARRGRLWGAALCANLSETVAPLEIRVEGGAKKSHDDPSTDRYHSGGRGGPQGTPTAVQRQVQVGHSQTGVNLCGPWPVGRAAALRGVVLVAPRNVAVVATEAIRAR